MAGGGVICAAARSCNQCGRALDSFRRGDSVPGLALLYNAREEQRIPQMSDFFSSPNELDSHMKKGRSSYTESKDSGPLVLLGQREASSVSEAWEATISRACPSPRSISG